MDLYAQNRWIIGETLTSLYDDGHVCVVHAGYPRLIGMLGIEYGQIKLDIYWSEAPLSDDQHAQLLDDAKHYFVEYNYIVFEYQLRARCAPHAPHGSLPEQQQDHRCEARCR